MDKITLDNFVLQTLIGKGSYAKVVLVKKKDTKEIFAMKILKKKQIEKKKQEEHVVTERNVLVEIRHPFIIQMHYSFQNERKLFFILEYCPGGELFNLLQKRQKFSEDQVNYISKIFNNIYKTRFYAAQIVLAIEKLHDNDIIYRDLKPENVLIDAQGYIRITDFGLSKKNIKGNKDAMSVCGTPEYLAPEVIFKTGHGKPVDWWTLGAICYEMITGLPPFYTLNREQLFDSIKYEQLKYPNTLTQQCKNLLDGLFIKNPDNRLGTKSTKEIKDHPWFLNVNWDILLKKQYKPPFIPVIKSETDVSNFDTEFTEQAINSHDPNSMSMGSESLQQNFMNFTYDGNNQMDVE